MTAAEVGETSGARAVVVVIASALLGGLTFGAQGLLPFELQSFANSASGWTLLTAALAAWSRAGIVAVALLVGMSVRRISGARQILGAVLGTVTVAAVFVVAYQGVGLIGA